MPSIKNSWFRTFRRRFEKRSVKEFIRAGGPPVIFPFYHVVSNDALPHIDHLYAYKNVAEFEGDMDFLLRHFTPLHYDDLVRGRFEKDKPYFHVSFDDGLSEMYHIVRPMLLEKGIPASFFVNSAFVDNRAMFYRYKVSILIDQVPADELAAAIAGVGENERIRVQDPKRFLLSLHVDSESLIDRIAATAGFDFGQYLASNRPYMDCSQISALQHEGFSIGAHSVDHPEFSYIAPASQHEQIKQSTDYVRAHFQVQQPAFAFPFTADGADPSVFEKMYSDYNVSRSFGTGGMQKQKYPYHIDRIPAEYDNWSLESVVKAEYHYFLAKKMLGR